MITIGITEMHGIAKEICKYPPRGVSYKELFPKPKLTDKLITSTAKGVMRCFDSKEVDLIEAPIFPVLTSKKWIYTPADFQTCANFSLMHLPLPRKMRVVMLKGLFQRDNFKKLLFKSNAGKNTLKSYGFIADDDPLMSKVGVVYPAVRRVDDALVNFNLDTVNLLFVGDFFGKGGAHVVDAFLEIRKQFNNVKLTICSSDQFKSKNKSLIGEYKEKISSCKDIKFGLVDREVLLGRILPETDIFLCPTYKESYGYAIEEAMAFGIPIIATNHFAIPEIVEHNKNGFLIDTQHFEFISNFKNYIVDYIPRNFHDHMNSYVYKYLHLLISNYQLRVKMGMASLDIARSKFSFEKRNKIMLNIYEETLD